jgi:aryl-alcohol dehydrogenase-like predicted oxidoreductase
MFSMETTTIAGAKVSRIGLGTWAIGGSEWGAVSDADGIATCRGALDRGINLIDTAPIYGHGRAEELVGKAIRAHGRRDAFFIATKAGLSWSSGGVFSDSTEPRLRQELEDSLRRLGTDYIDLYQIHWPDTLIPVSETAALMAEFQREGKVRAVGVSNFSVAQMRAFRSVVPLASNQPPYNLFERQIEGCAPCECSAHREDSEDGVSVLDFCRQNQIAVLTYSSLCRSLLAGRVHRGMHFETSDIRSVDPKFQEPRFSQYMTAVERLAALAGERFGKSVLELAARWVLDRPGISVALWGAKRPEQLDAVAGVMGWTLDTTAFAEIDRIVAESVTDPVGPEYLTPGVRAVS